MGARIGELYASVFRPVFLLGVVLFAVTSLLGLARWAPPAGASVGLALLAAIGSRIALLAYIEVTSFPAFGNWSAYITPLYPLMLLFAAVAIADATSTAARTLEAIRTRNQAAPIGG
jgi:hypothetical protein